MGTTYIAELHTLEMIPQPLYGIEFRGVAGPLDQVQALGGTLDQELLDEPAAMGG